jgi:hypothetical protein
VTRCDACGQPLPTPAGPHVVDGVMVEPVPLGVEGVTVWRAVGRPDLPVCSYPPAAAALAKDSPAPATRPAEASQLVIPANTEEPAS